jgi:putative ABC transport system permease protein
MFKNYFLSAYRNIVRNKFYSAINVVGLAIGIICAILILLYVQEELTFDKHHSNYERIYRLESDFTISGKNTLAALVPMPMAPTLMDEYPEIENYVRFAGFGIEDILFTYQEKKFYEDNIYFADSSVFDVFTHEFIFGSPEKALNEPNTMVITESFSQRYFGDANPVGEVLTSSNFGDFRVTGVIKNVPANSHLTFDCLLSMATIVELAGVERFNDRSAGSFWNISVFGYLLLKENTSIEGLHTKFPDFYEKYMASLGNQINASFNLMSQRMDQVHFHSTLEFDLPVGNYNYIIIFSLVGVFMLIIACVNYMNMSTARSTTRAKEVGLRKVIGAHRISLIRQFLSESIVLAVTALILSLVITILILPYFNELAGKEIFIADLFKPFTVISVLLITLFVGVVSGSYPSFYLSSFLPVTVLKGTLPKEGKGLFRKILVIFQFILSVALIIGTIVVSSQQRFIQNKDLGMNKENLLLIPSRDTTFINNQLKSFKEELTKNPNIKGVTSSILIPPRMASKVVFQVEKEEGLVEVALSFSIVDHDFLEVMEIELLEGRDFDEERTTDLTEAFIINETAANNLGWGNEALGKRVRFGINPADGTARNDGVVIGVVKDFHFSSIHNTIEPFVFLVSENPTLNFYVRIDENNEAETLEFIRNKRIEMGNTLPFNYFFFTEKLDEMYSSEKKLSYLFSIFALLTIFISCLGLLGLTSFITQQRTREIGIRKVMGATSTNITWMLNKDFLILVIIGNIIAWPFAYLAMVRWLQDFAYRIEFSISPFVFYTLVPFVLATLISVFIAMITVSLLSIRSANANPVDAIRHE